MRSLTVKLLLALVITGIVGIGFVGILAQRTAITQFDNLIIEETLSGFLDTATEYYVATGSWEGLGDVVRQSGIAPNRGRNNSNRRPGQGQNNREGPNDPPPQPRFLLVDQNNRVVASDGGFRIGVRADVRNSERQIPVEINGEEVGILYFLGGNPELAPQEQTFINQINRALLLAALGALLVAILIGTLLTRTLLRPLQELTDAIRAMRGGELEQQVAVTTNDEVGELIQAFNQMSADLAQSQQLRQQMTADIAHELRTPLTVITGYIEGLKDGVLQPNNERFEVMHDEATQLKRLIDDLRTLSLADAGELKLNLQPISPKTLLDTIAKTFQPLADQQDIKLKTDLDNTLSPVDIDRERMLQVFHNLVSNALRYTPTGGQITLSATHDNNATKFSVQDTGSGIPPEKLPYIFERFYRVDDTRFQTDHQTGLGLAIARSIVEAHGASIIAESASGKGTTISIRIPHPPTSKIH